MRINDVHGHRYESQCSVVAEMGDRLATIDMGRKVGEGCCVPFWGLEKVGSRSNCRA